MDITLQIIATSKTHSTNDVNNLWQRGQILDAYQSADLATLTNGDYLFNDVISGSFVYVHVTDAPVVDFNKFKRRLHTENPLGGRRRYRVDVPSVPQAAKDKLIADREITIPFTTAKNYIMNDELSSVITNGEID